MEIRRLKGTDRRYEILGRFSHRCGTDNGESITEEWAKCISPEGAIALWESCQLEPT
jgi:hypothetical protein